MKKYTVLIIFLVVATLIGGFLLLKKNKKEEKNKKPLLAGTSGTVNDFKNYHVQAAREYLYNEGYEALKEWESKIEITPTSTDKDVLSALIAAGMSEGVADWILFEMKKEHNYSDNAIERFDNAIRGITQWQGDNVAWADEVEKSKNRRGINKKIALRYPKIINKQEFLLAIEPATGLKVDTRL